MSNILSKRKDESKALTVTQLTAKIRGTLESGFADVVVQGEISGWSPAASGHAYYSIKDDGALLGCVMWRSTRERLSFTPSEGMKVECRGRISVFEKRGQYQLTVEGMKLAGEGELYLRFMKLKAKLEAAGLFDTTRKRPLPPFPKAVGVVTSPTGAAIQDILNILGRRAPGLPVFIFPARVQGDGAGQEIARAVRVAAASGLVDLLIVGRGGGSAEDLWEFNDEELAQAIFTCCIPVVSAVGHEIDTSISDFVADLRAPTPSAAAEIVSEAFVDLRERLVELQLRARRSTESLLRERRRHLSGLVNSHALRRPELLLRELQQRTDSAMKRMPEVLLRRLERLRSRIERNTGSLEGHNPDLILKKGYAVIRRARDQRVLTKVEDLRRNLSVDVELSNGKRRAIVTDDAAPDLFE